MGIQVIDTGTSQRNLNFPLAFSQGWRSCYVKLGGDNVGRYVAPYYVSEVDRARAAGMRVGHYWVPSSGQSPEGAADYFVANLRGWTASDYAVLDNENLDGHARYNDGQAAAWVNRVRARLGVSGAQVFTYSGLADARGTAWPAVLSTGSNFILAAYSYPAGQVPIPGTIPGSRAKGHQYGGGPIGGVVTDTNLFTDDAFNYAASSSTPEEKRDMTTGAFFRQTSNGGIYYQREPHTPLIGLDLPTWKGYAANGNISVELSDSEINFMISNFTVVDKPEPTGGTISGDVTVEIDYEKLANTLFDVQARRIAS